MIFRNSSFRKSQFMGNIRKSPKNECWILVLSVDYSAANFICLLSIIVEEEANG